MCKRCESMRAAGIPTPSDVRATLLLKAPIRCVLCRAQEPAEWGDWSYGSATPGDRWQARRIDHQPGVTTSIGFAVCPDCRKRADLQEAIDRKLAPVFDQVFPAPNRN